MKYLWKVLMINVVTVLTYAGIILITIGRENNGDMEGMGVAIVMMFAVAAQVIANFIISIGCFAAGRKSWGHAFLVNSIFMILIGFSTCVGVASIRL